MKQNGRARRMLSWLMCICMAFTLPPSSALAMPAPGGIAEDGYVEIEDAQGLAAIANDLEGSYRLIADITLENAWTPLTEAAPAGPSAVFSGVLDGGGHVIKNLYMAEGEEYASFFGDTGDAEIRNLGIILADGGAVSTYDAGGLVSFMVGGVIENCYVSGAVENSEPQDCWAGGLVAYLFSGTISACYTTGCVTGGGAGGLVGYMEDGKIENCYSLAAVQGESDAGGLVGALEGGCIHCCYAAGKVSSESALAPGLLLGTRNDSCQITSSYYELREEMDGIGSDYSPADAAPTGVSGVRLKSGVPLNLDRDADAPTDTWDQTIWWFAEGAYPRHRTAEDAAPEKQLAQPTGITYAEPEAAGNRPVSYRIKVPAVADAVGYSVQLYREVSVWTWEAVGQPYTMRVTGSASAYDIPLDEVLSSAAKEEIAEDPTKTTFRYLATVTAVGSNASARAAGTGGNRDSVSSELIDISTTFQRLTSITQLQEIVCKKGDSLTRPTAVNGMVNGASQQLAILWNVPLYTMPTTADFVGKQTFSAPLLLPVGVLNPDDWAANQVVKSYTAYEAPTALAWDSAVPGKATWTLPSDPGSVVLAQLLDSEKNPVGEEKTIPWKIEQSYDFTALMRETGSGDYYFRVKTPASVDGYSRESAWVTVAKACHYTAPPTPGAYYTLTAAAGEGGKITPSGRVSVFRNGSKTFTITPDPGCVVYDVLVDGESVGAVTAYTFKDVQASHTIEVLFKKESGRPAWNPFVDVREGDWFYDDVRYVYENGQMIGTSDTTFAPYRDTTRGMIVTILWRQEGRPGDGTLNPYGDLEGGAYYYDAVAWADKHGIVLGYGNGKFGPDDPITREQMAAILYRYAKYKERDTSAADDLSRFTDQPSAWARESVQWAVGAGLIEGKGGGVLDSTGKAVRAEVAAMLKRYLNASTSR